MNILKIKPWIFSVNSRKKRSETFGSRTSDQGINSNNITPSYSKANNLSADDNAYDGAIF